MSILRSPASFRRTAAGLALIVASLMFVVSQAITPAGGGDTVAYLEHVAQSPGLHAAAGLLQVLGFAILVAGIVGVVHLIRGRGVTLAHIGGALAVLGLGTFPALAFTGIIDSIAVDTLGRDAHVALIEEGFENSAWAIVVLVVSLGGVLGTLLIGAAVWRSGLAPWWAGAAIILGAVVLTAASNRPLFLIGNVLQLVGLGYVGLGLLRMTDREWETPPADWRNDRRDSATDRAGTNPAPGGTRAERLAR